jgi:hypothetical protein
MKKSCLLTLLGCTLAAAPVMAANYDLYITGSTAFRPNVFAACSKIFDGGAPVNQINSSGVAPGGGDNNWAMSGPCAVAGIVSPDTLTIHGLFTGSVQGQHAILNNDLLGFVGSATSSTIVSNYATIAFSDVFSKPTIAPLSSGFTEQPVAIQPFVFVKSTAPAWVSKVKNITFQQIQSMIVPGNVPLSYLTGNIGDAVTNVYLLHRSLDSGTRVTLFQETKSSGTVKIVYWDATDHTFTNAGTLGPALYGPGYTSGGNLRTALQGGDSANQSISYLSMADAQTITTTNWSNILQYNGLYPIANWTPTNTPAGGSGQVGSGNAITNDYSPVITGQYSFWAFECLDYPKSTQWSSQSGQDLDYTTQFTPLVNRLIATYSGSGTLNGSIDYEIELSKTIAPYATAIRINDSAVARSVVGGLISP